MSRLRLEMAKNLKAAVFNDIHDLHVFIINYLQ